MSDSAIVLAAYHDDQLLDDVQASAFFGGKPAAWTLRHWRLQSRGPRWVRVGRLARYRVKDLRVWIDRNTVVTNDDPAEPLPLRRAS